MFAVKGGAGMYRSVRDGNLTNATCAIGVGEEGGLAKRLPRVTQANAHLEALEVSGQSRELSIHLKCSGLPLGRFGS